MREILCKAKRKDNGKWIEGYYLKSWACRNGNKYDVHLIHNYELDDGWEIDIDTLCQLTHMTDINGKQIWENDVVKTSNDFVLQVVWSDESQEFMFKNLKDSGYFENKARVLSAYTRDKKVKVIGNVFDNKRLIA